jgi:hypothetical protein
MWWWGGNHEIRKKISLKAKKITFMVIEFHYDITNQEL